MPRSRADLQQCAQLRRRRAVLTAQVYDLRARTLQLWRDFQQAQAAGESLHQFDALLNDAEEACYWLDRALMAIDDELCEGDE
jgi:hypothetical protein